MSLMRVSLFNASFKTRTHHTRQAGTGLLRQQPTVNFREARPCDGQLSIRYLARIIKVDRDACAVSLRGG